MFKLESTTVHPRNVRIIEDFDKQWLESGPDNMIVPEKSETDDSLDPDSILKNFLENSRNSSVYKFEVSRLIIRPEEAFIVIFVLILWIGAILLFIHRWGKIRMLEPYTPKFEAEHRPSCTTTNDPLKKRTSFSSKMVLSSVQCTAPGASTNLLHMRGLDVPGRLPLGLRRSSVFVTTPTNLSPDIPRKSKSVMDIHSLVSSRNNLEVV